MRKLLLTATALAALASSPAIAQQPVTPMTPDVVEIL